MINVLWLHDYRHLQNNPGGDASAAYDHLRLVQDTLDPDEEDDEYPEDYYEEDEDEEEESFMPYDVYLGER